MHGLHKGRGSSPPRCAPVTLGKFKELRYCIHKDTYTIQYQECKNFIRVVLVCGENEIPGDCSSDCVDADES
jgi:hypothetical protein